MTTGDYTIKLGAHNIDIIEPWTVEAKVKKIIVHSSFSPVTLLDNIALLKLTVIILVKLFISLFICIH
jgi:hypothetical protein